MATETQTATASAPKSAASMTHLPSQQQTFQPPLIANENAFLGDVASSADNAGKDKAVTCGFFRLEKGTPLVYTYTYVCPILEYLASPLASGCTHGPPCASALSDAEAGPGTTR